MTRRFGILVLAALGIAGWLWFGFIAALLVWALS